MGDFKTDLADPILFQWLGILLEQSASFGEALTEGQVPRAATVSLYKNAGTEEISVDAALVALLADVHQTDAENDTQISSLGCFFALLPTSFGSSILMATET